MKRQNFLEARIVPDKKIMRVYIYTPSSSEVYVAINSDVVDNNYNISCISDMNFHEYIIIPWRDLHALSSL